MPRKKPKPGSSKPPQAKGPRAAAQPARARARLARDNHTEPSRGRGEAGVEASEELRALLHQETLISQEVPLREGSSVTYRDEANVIVHQVLRSGFLEQLHKDERITQDEMKRLMIETSAELAHWLYARDLDLAESPRHYLDKLQMLRNIYIQEWERHAVTWSPASSRMPGIALCASCRAPLHHDWRFCPVCGQAAPAPAPAPE